ncbi:type II toxin-antitoxin system HicA family toxin [Methanohalophilus sp.]
MPLHDPLKKGTLKSILRQANVEPEELLGFLK